MATVSPFRGIHYDATKVPDLSDVVIPPYDNIPAGDDDKYRSRSPYNFAHVDLPQSPEDDYSRARSVLAKWREVGVLREDTTPSYYVYQQDFVVNGTKHRRQSLMAAVQLVDFAEGIVRPHERTFGNPKADRLRVLRGTHCNLSHVFAMVKDKEGFLTRLYERFLFAAPLLAGRTDDGTEHAVWRIEGDKAKDVAAFFKDEPIYIVDGHHRYESALAYAKELGVLGDPTHPAAHTLCTIANTYDPALVVMPTHRRVTVSAPPALDAIAKKFDLHRMSYEGLKTFLARPGTDPSFALYAAHELYHAVPKGWRSEETALGPSLARLAVVWSDWKLLKDFLGVDDGNRAERVSYFKDAEELWKKRDDAHVLVFHAPPQVEDVTRVADEKRFMPQKSTFFYPKLAGGFILRAIA